MECRLPDITVHYEGIGEGPLNVLPGWPDDGKVPADYLEPAFEDRAGWRRIYLDLPGRGLTKGEPWITSNDDVLRIVLDVIDRIVPDERFVVAGHSAGAYLARAVVARRGDMLDGLLQVVPVIDPNETAEMHPDRVTIMSDATLVARMEADYGSERAAANAVPSSGLVRPWAPGRGRRILHRAGPHGSLPASDGRSPGSGRARAALGTTGGLQGSGR